MPDWYPTPITELEKLFTRCIADQNAVTNQYVLIKNLCYNFQFLEYLDKCLKENDVSSVLRTELQKTFIVTSAAVVEGVVYYLVYSLGHHKVEEWDDVKTVSSAQQKIGDDIYRFNTTLSKKLNTPRALRNINLKDLLRIAEKNHLLGDNHELYSRLQQLRRLRNKIHLYLSDRMGDHDFNVFTQEGVNEAKKLVHHIMHLQPFDIKVEDERIFHFLKQYES